MRAVLFIFVLSVATAIAASQNVTQIIQGYGYNCENHYVTTDDGYVLVMERIPNPGAKVPSVDWSNVFAYAFRWCIFNMVFSILPTPG